MPHMLSLKIIVLKFIVLKLIVVIVFEKETVITLEGFW